MISSGLAIAGLLPVALLCIFAYKLASSRLHKEVVGSNSAVAGVTGELVRSDMTRMMDMASALSAQPGMVDAIQRRDAEAVSRRLKATFDAVNQSAADPIGLKAGVRRIDRTFVTDPTGLQWADYPHAPESIGKNFSTRDWYRGVSASWRPYLSEVYQRNSEPRILIVAMAAPVKDTDGKVVGIIVFQMPLAYLSDVLKSIHVGGSGYTYVVDYRGTIVAHPKLPDLASQSHKEPAGNASVMKALQGQTFTEEYADPITGEPMVAAFNAINLPSGTWVAVAQQPSATVYGPIRRMGVSIAVAGVLMAAAIFLLVYTLRRASLRDRRLSRELEKTATAERAARLEALAASESLRQTQGRLVQSEKLAALGQLVAGVAHEINNPLAFVLNNVAVMQRDVAAIDALIKLYQSGDDALAERKPEVLARIRELCNDIDLPYTMEELLEGPIRSREGLVRIQQIVKDLRDFARQNVVGELQPDAAINTGIESTLNIARGMAKKHQVELVSDLADVPTITCSPGRINQVVLNLITNAVHASPANEKVIVRTRPYNSGVSIEVVDHGCGIDPAIRDRIFDPFFTTKPQGEGTGLGLSISHGIVADHGGFIDVEPTPGKGTTFRIFLPLGKSVAPQAEGVARRQASVESTTH